MTELSKYKQQFFYGNKIKNIIDDVYQLRFIFWPKCHFEFVLYMLAKTCHTRQRGGII